MSENLDRLLRMFNDLSDYSILPELAREISRGGYFHLLPPLVQSFNRKIDSILLHKMSSSKARRLTAEFKSPISTLYSIILSPLTIYYPIDISLDPQFPYPFTYHKMQNKKDSSEVPIRFKRKFTQYSLVEKTKLGRPEPYFNLPVENPIFFPIRSKSTKFEFNAQGHLVNIPFFVESFPISCFEGHIVLEFKYAEDLSKFSIPHREFFNSLFSKIIRIKGIDPNVFTTSSS